MKKGEVLINEGTITTEMFITKEGHFDVQKVIKIADVNYWPIEGNKWECLKKSMNFKKSVFCINPLEFFALNESLDRIPISSTLTAKTNNTILLRIYTNDILNILSQEDILNLRKSHLNIQIPDQIELVKKAVID